MASLAHIMSFVSILKTCSCLIFHICKWELVSFCREKNVIDFSSGIGVYEILTTYTAFPVFDVSHCDTVGFLSVMLDELGLYRD